MVELKGAQQIPSVHFCSRLLPRSFNPIPSWDSAEVWGIFTHQPSCRAAGLPASRPTGMPAYGSTHNKEQKKRTTVQRLLFHYKRIKERPFFIPIATLLAFFSLGIVRQSYISGGCLDTLSKAHTLWHVDDVTEGSTQEVPMGLFGVNFVFWHKSIVRVSQLNLYSFYGLCTSSVIKTKWNNIVHLVAGFLRYFCAYSCLIPGFEQYHLFSRRWRRVCGLVPAHIWTKATDWKTFLFRLSFVHLPVTVRLRRVCVCAHRRWD